MKCSFARKLLSFSIKKVCYYLTLFIDMLFLQLNLIKMFWNQVPLHDDFGSLKLHKFIF